MSDFEGYIQQLIRECATISHYHNGLSYADTFELTPFEKQIICDFIEEDQKRQFKMKAAMFGMG